GHHVDALLEKHDVRLTQGGEPTFVSVDDMEADEWNTDADGPHKRERAAVLAAALREQYAPGGLVHRGQGKWYPGEPLPRWQVALQWLADGGQVWHRPDLLADPWSDEPAEGAHESAQALARSFTRLLGLPEQALLAAHEDALAQYVADLRKPEGPAPEARDVVDEITFLQDEDDVVSGWVLPLVTGEEWRSPAWSFRRGRLVLTPGTSAVGLRLPLDSITWTDPEASGDPSYLTAGPPLAPEVPAVEIVDPDEQPTTAIAFEARDGFVHVFLPPTERLEDYVALAHVIELAATEVDTPVVIEGYGPPPDPRLTQLVVTPDPGVIEVNVQPAGSWEELRDLTVGLYRTAVASRLGTEKFELDGSHTGTGGGNHITLGGRVPEDSPMLRRPDLLASMIRYWQRHPSLSYLFSGRFIGPTSQAPRFDEGRPEAVYEMRIALDELSRLAAETAELGDEPRPWLTDRALRHLLTDLTGNTHRAEFCIDKLYSPDSSRGRLGLLELRGFEMPPHPHMALVQSLLVRSIVAMFAAEPCTDDLIDWGTALHDDMLSPFGVRRDIDQVVDDLVAAGIPFERSWLDPFVEFRFPHLGTTSITTSGGEAVTLELRQAIEPWNVLGEEAASGGTARYVDSSIERLQVLVTGLEPGRHAVTVAGVAVPLTPTGTPRQHVAGVRYRAWQPWSALHPSIEMHSPL
ncbi:MAG: transglutaminase, partial [Actinomycetales bacterium]